MRTAVISTLMVALAAGGCGSVEPIVCTEEFRAGINVEVVDALNGAALAQGATLTLQEGEYVENWTETFGNTLSGAWERAGTYDVSVAHEGYHDWNRAGVRITEDECHVQPVALRAELDRTTGR